MSIETPKIEPRYLVLKLDDCCQYLTPQERVTLDDLSKKVNAGRAKDGKKGPSQGLFISKSWPIYRAVKQLLLNWLGEERREKELQKGYPFGILSPTEGRYQGNLRVKLVRETPCLYCLVDEKGGEWRVRKSTCRPVGTKKHIFPERQLVINK